MEERERFLLLEKEQEAYSKMEAAKEDMPPKAAGCVKTKRKNVRYFVDGEEVSARKLARVQEDGSYMADYVYGKGGRIEEIHYDRIKPR